MTNFFSALGSLDIRLGDGGSAEGLLSQPKRMALLGYLAVATPRGFQRRDVIVALLWPELDQAHARNALSQALYHLRKTLAPEVIVTRGDEEIALSDSAIRCDVWDFDTALAGNKIEEALALYRGDLMAGLFISGAGEFERWLDVERARYKTRASSAAWSLAESCEVGGRDSDATRWGRRAAALAPDDESGLRRLISLLDRFGDRAGALRAYDEFARWVAAEYESEPAAETQQLIRSVRSRTESHTTRRQRITEKSANDAPPVAPPRLEVVTQTNASPKRRVLYAAIAAIAVVSSLAFYFARQPKNARDPTGQSIAVLPFLDLSQKHDEEYLSDGMSEELSDALSRLRDLRVTSRTSAFAFKGKSADARTIGRALGVKSLLEGSVRKDGDRIRVTAQLIDARTGYHMWSRTYDRELSDVFAVQDEIARAIADELDLRLSGTVVPRPASFAAHVTHSPAAYDLYLRGRYFWNRRTGEALTKAIELFESAIAADSLYASAYAGLADSYNVLAGQTYQSPAESFSKAKPAALRAIALDSTLAEAHAALGFIYLFGDWNGIAARRELERALALDPSYATARLYLAFSYLTSGESDAAIPEIRLAQMDDPLSLIINARVGFVLVMARRFNDAIAEERRTLQLDSTFAPAYWSLGDAYTGIRKFDDASSEFSKARANSSLLLGDIGYSYAAAGNPSAARRYLAEMDSRSRTAYVDPYDRALVYAGLGERDAAIRWLDVGRRQHSASIIWLRVEPMFDGLRADPRFDSLVKAVGL